MWKKVGLGLLGLLILSATITAYREAAETPQEREARAHRLAAVERTAFSEDIVKMAVAKQLRDPVSAQFGPMRAYADRKFNGNAVVAICGNVNAKNAFGGYVGAKDFVVIRDSYLTAIDNDVDNRRFVGLWNALCAGKHE